MKYYSYDTIYKEEEIIKYYDDLFKIEWIKEAVPVIHKHNLIKTRAALVRNHEGKTRLIKMDNSTIKLQVGVFLYLPITTKFTRTSYLDESIKEFICENYVNKPITRSDIRIFWNNHGEMNHLDEYSHNIVFDELKSNEELLVDQLYPTGVPSSIKPVCDKLKYKLVTPNIGIIRKVLTPIE